MVGFLFVLLQKGIIQILKDRHILRGRIVEISLVDLMHTTVNNRLFDRLQAILTAPVSYTHLATALEIYVKGSLKLFNNRTNVDIQNRLVCFDIKELGNQLKKIGKMFIRDRS